MSGTVAEFMQKPVKKYACGKRAEQAKKVLMNAFTASSKRKAADEKAYFGEMIDIVNKTPTGRETLKKLSKAGCTFHFESLEGQGGYFDPNNNEIIINKNMSLQGMASLLVHEGTHAVQWALKGKPDFRAVDYTVASLYQNQRAGEADAYAHQTAFHYECKTAYPALYQVIREKNPHLCGFLDAYEGEVEKSGDSGKALKKTFESWYENSSIMNNYDAGYKSFLKNACDAWKDDKDQNLFIKDLPVKDIVKQFRHNGKPYVSEDFLTKGLAFSIKPQDKQEIYAAMIDYAKAIGGKADISVLKMNDRTADGELIPARNKDEVKTAAVTKAKQQGR